MSLDTAKVSGLAFLDREREEITRLLKQLGNDHADIADQGMAALRLGADIAFARIQGKDTSFAEQGLQVIRANIESATSSVIAGAVMGWMQDALKRATQAVMAIAFAALA